VNKVFEEASVPYEPRLEPGSEACEEAAKRRKNDAGTRPSVKHAKMSSWKTMHVKASVAPKGMGAESSKTVLARAPPDTHASRGTSVPQKASMSKVATTVAATVTSSRADVLRISTGVKRPAAALPPRAKGKQVKVSMKRPVALKVGTPRRPTAPPILSLLWLHRPQLRMCTFHLEVEVAIATVVRTTSPEGWISLFLRFCLLLFVVVILHN
jgi:hypothetical protein